MPDHDHAHAHVPCLGHAPWAFRDHADGDPAVPPLLQDHSPAHKDQSECGGWSDSDLRSLTNHSEVGGATVSGGQKAIGIR